MKTLPTSQEAEKWDFARLSTTIRQHIESSARGCVTQQEEALLDELVALLESRIPPIPQKPRTLESPPEPTLPPKPSLPNLNYTPSELYVSTKKSWEHRISELGDHPSFRKQIAQLRAAMEGRLLRIMLSEVNLAAAVEYRQKEVDIKRWELRRDVALAFKGTKAPSPRAKALREAKAKASFEERLKRDVALWETAERNWKIHYEIQLRITRNLRWHLENFTKSGVEPLMQKLPWRFLPPDEMREATILASLRDYRRRHSGVEVDEARIRFAFSLKPESVYVGADEFDGYVAFVFPYTKRVLLDHPIEGNAAYIFHREWRFLSKLPKMELIGSHAGEVARVVHSGDWCDRIRCLLSTHVRPARSGGPLR